MENNRINPAIERFKALYRTVISPTLGKQSMDYKVYRVTHLALTRSGFKRSYSYRVHQLGSSKKRAELVLMGLNPFIKTNGVEQEIATEFGVLDQKINDHFGELANRLSSGIQTWQSGTQQDIGTLVREIDGFSRALTSITKEICHVKDSTLIKKRSVLIEGSTNQATIKELYGRLTGHINASFNSKVVNSDQFARHQLAGVKATHSEKVPVATRALLLDAAFKSAGRFRQDVSTEKHRGAVQAYKQAITKALVETAEALSTAIDQSIGIDAAQGELNAVMLELGNAQKSVANLPDGQAKDGLASFLSRRIKRAHSELHKAKAKADTKRQELREVVQQKTALAAKKNREALWASGTGAVLRSQVHRGGESLTRLIRAHEIKKQTVTKSKETLMAAKREVEKRKQSLLAFLKAHRVSEAQRRAIIDGQQTVAPVAVPAQAGVNLETVRSLIRLRTAALAPKNGLQKILTEVGISPDKWETITLRQIEVASQKPRTGVLAGALSLVGMGKSASKRQTIAFDKASVAMLIEARDANPLKPTEMGLRGVLRKLGLQDRWETVTVEEVRKANQQYLEQAAKSRPDGRAAKAALARHSVVATVKEAGETISEFRVARNVARLQQQRLDRHTQNKVDLSEAISKQNTLNNELGTKAAGQALQARLLKEEATKAQRQAVEAQERADKLSELLTKLGPPVTEDSTSSGPVVSNHRE